jgi:Translocation protein Sec62
MLTFGFTIPSPSTTGCLAACLLSAPSLFVFSLSGHHPSGKFYFWLWHIRLSFNFGYRKGVYYLSVAAAGFLIFIIALAILRVVVFALLWTLTLGKHHLWLLPNLTEDVGFLPSFWPLYQVRLNWPYFGVGWNCNFFQYEYKGGKSSDKSKKKKKKAKDSDAEEEDETSNLVEGKE